MNSPVQLSDVRDVASLSKLLEVLLFVSDQPQTPAALLEQLTQAPETDEGEPLDVPELTEEDVTDALAHLEIQLSQADGIYTLAKRAGGYQLLTKEAYAPLVRRAHVVRAKRRLSRAALEVLSIVAYRQPVTRAEIEFVRGVNSEYALTKLLEKQLVEPAGRADLPGKPLLYRTSQHFLVYFGLDTPNELPTPKELKDEEAEADTYTTAIPDGQTPEA